MDIQNITELAHKLQNEMPFLSGIHTEQENNQALELMERLIEDYDNNLLLIDILWKKIEDYENDAPELAEFNNGIKNLNAGSSMLRLLIDQHGLNTTLFANEIGGKSTVSMICNGKRKLTVEHIEKLSQRFEISPALFF
ncbi:helix-turn-helix domain-containing protein [Aliivibrio sifiae]